MCVVAAPILAYASLAATAASGVMSAMGAEQQAAAQASAARYNATLANQNANTATQQANAQAFQISQQGAQKMGAARAALAASGVDANGGSALMVQEGIGQTTGQDIANTRYNANLQSLGYRNQAALDTSQANNAETAGDMGAASSLLGAASQFSGRWAGFQSIGALGGGGNGTASAIGNLAGTGIPTGWGG